MFYLIDKPLEYTSFDVLRILRKKLNIKKMWHTGTLDPLATGGLLIAIWNYTKLIPYFEKDTKEYEFSVSFDGVTDSYDLWTTINYISETEKNLAKNNITIEKINDLLKNKFTWEVKQIPPKYSALKINWKKAIDMIVLWKTDFEMKERKCFIYEIELLSYHYPCAKFRTKVSAWTYVRTIAYDLWKFFGTWAYVTELRRTKVWNLDLSFSQTLDNFDKDSFFDLKAIFNNKSFIELSQDMLEELNLWRKLEIKKDYKIWEDMFVFDGKNVTNIVTYDWTFLIPKRKI